MTALYEKSKNMVLAFLLIIHTQSFINKGATAREGKLLFDPKTLTFIIYCNNWIIWMCI